MHNIDIKKEWSSGESMFDVPYYFWKNFFSSEEVDTIIKALTGSINEIKKSFNNKDAPKFII